MAVPYNVITQVVRLVFSNSEPYPPQKTMWAKHISGDEFSFFVYDEGAWQDVSGSIVIPEISVYLSAFVNDAGFITEEALAGYQEVLISGENIKTINNQSILGEGNITIEGGTQEQADWNESDTTAPSYIKNKPTIPTVTGKADKVSGATNGNLAGLDSNGNLTDSGKKASDFATAAQGTLAASAYQKPSGGIPSTDLSQAVQTSLGKADSAYQKPSGGIPSTDLASGVIPDVSSKEDTSNKTSDISSNTSSTTKYPSTKGVADYVDGIVGDINTILDNINGEVI